MLERIEELRRQIRVLDWDLAKNQLNVNKTAYLNRLKAELGSLEEQYKTSLQPEPEENLLEKEL
jgi:hypothetical protein